ncbi:hypothetical protein EST38_g303 [Candolleomyces aberdarensis]|uniref:Protein FRA10AC1 n=1 Tax=Candolleomyces aberdarensis TaxID=2316362 RepID=A0A4Q2DXP5_9AGAR|nr:hypothetical protein EST38_g303 [Candolleomyces aberdarensis]
MALYRYGASSSTSKTPSVPTGVTEFEILKARHKFLREDQEDGNEPTTWDDKLASKYYDSLYREFAICDLKHYKSGNFSLRWRTEQEVLDGTGETSCANSRCEFHRDPSPAPALTTLELPFAYTEQNEPKSALVKVVLCSGCVKKLMWKRRKEKKKELESASEKALGRALEKEREKERKKEREKADSGRGGGGEDDQYENDDDVSTGKVKRRSRRDVDPAVDRAEDHKSSRRSRRHEDDLDRRDRPSRKRDRSVTDRGGSGDDRDRPSRSRKRRHSSRSRSPRRPTDQEASERQRDRDRDRV